MKRAFGWWAQNFLWAEFATAVLVTTAFAAWTYWYGGNATVSEIIQGNRGAVYGALASIFGSLLGFAITAESIVLALSGSERLEIIRESKHYATLWRVFISSIRALAIATLLSLLALIFDRDTKPLLVFLVLTVFGSSLAFFRVLRCIWVLENVVALIGAPSKERKGGE